MPNVCRDDVRIAILNEVNKDLTAQKFAVVRVDTDTYRIAMDRKERKGKDRLSPAYEHAQRVKAFIEEEYNRWVNAEVYEPGSVSDPILVYVRPDPRYVDREYRAYWERQGKVIPEEQQAKKQQEATQESNVVYSMLGNRTISGNVRRSSWANLKDATSAIVRGAGNRIVNVIATRIKGNKTEHFGNVWSHDARIVANNPGLIKADTVKEAVLNYIDWVLGNRFENVYPERRDWIRRQLQSGELKGVPIQYFDELNEPSHATALDYLINKYDWGTKTDITKQLVRTMTPERKAIAVSGDEDAQREWMREEISEFYDALRSGNKDEIADETIGLFRTAQQFPAVASEMDPYMNDIRSALSTFSYPEEFKKWKAKKEVKGQAKDVTVASLRRFIQQMITPRRSMGADEVEDHPIEDHAGFIDYLNAKFNYVVQGRVVNNPRAPWKARIVGNQVEINSANANMSDGFHEYSHPMLMAMRRDNPTLFNSLYQELTETAEWQAIAKASQERVRKNYSDLTDANDLKEEVLATALGYAASQKYHSLSEKFKAVIQKIMDYINKFLGTHFGQTVLVDPIKLNSSLQEMAEYMSNPKYKIAVPDNWWQIYDAISDKELNVIPTADQTDLNPAEVDVQKPSFYPAEEFIEQMMKAEQLESELDPDPTDLIQMLLQQTINDFHRMAQAMEVPIEISRYLKVPKSVYKPRKGVTIFSPKGGTKIPVTSKFAEQLRKQANGSTVLTKPFDTQNLTDYEREVLTAFRSEVLKEVNKWARDNNKPVPTKIQNSRLLPKLEDFIALNYPFEYYETVAKKDTYGFPGPLTREGLKLPRSGYEVVLSNGFLTQNGHLYQIQSQKEKVIYKGYNGLGWYIYLKVGDKTIIYEYQSDFTDGDNNILKVNVQNSIDKNLAFIHEKIGLGMGPEVFDQRIDGLTNAIEQSQDEYAQTEAHEKEAPTTKDFSTFLYNFSGKQVDVINKILQEQVHYKVKLSRLKRFLGEERYEQFLDLTTTGYESVRLSDTLRNEPAMLRNLSGAFSGLINMHKGYNRFRLAEKIAKLDRQRSVLRYRKEAAGRLGSDPKLVKYYNAWKEAMTARIRLSAMQNENDRLLAHASNDTTKLNSSWFTKSLLSSFGYAKKKGDSVVYLPTAAFMRTAGDATTPYVTPYDLQNVKQFEPVDNVHHSFFDINEREINRTTTYTGSGLEDLLKGYEEDGTLTLDGKPVTAEELMDKIDDYDKHGDIDKSISVILSDDTPRGTYITNKEATRLYNEVLKKNWGTTNTLGGFYLALRKVKNIEFEIVNIPEVKEPMIKVDISNWEPKPIERFSRDTPAVQDEQAEEQPSPEEKQPLLPQKEQKKASTKTLQRVNEFLKRNGIDVQPLAKEYGGMNGVALMLHRVVQIAQGKEEVALTEEAAHFAIDMIERTNPALFNAMLNRIGQYKIYQDTLKAYSQVYTTEEGKPDIRRIKKEAMGKVLAEYVINASEGIDEKPELVSQSLNWWKQIKEWFLNLIKKAQFDPFELAAGEFDSLSGEVGTDEYYQLSDTQEDLKRKLDDTDKNIRKVVPDKNAGTVDADDDDNNWYEKLLANGTWERVKHRVTDQVAAYKKQIFGDKQFEPKDKEFYELLRETGILGHSDMEEILHRFIDSEGKLKETPDKRPAKSQMDPEYDDIYIKLETYVKDLLSRFPKGTVFYPELIVFDELYDKSSGEAGTIDLVAQEPDGTVHIYDWKFMRNDKRSPDVVSWKQGAFDRQIGRYKQILQERYGIKKFGKTRAIPIYMDFGAIRTQTGTEPFLRDVFLGSANTKEIEKLKELPVPTLDETTGIEEVDYQLGKLNALYKRKQAEKSTSSEEREIKRGILESLRTAIRALQTQQNIEPMIDGAKIFMESVNSIREAYDELFNFAPDDPALTNKSKSYLATALTEAIAIADVYADMKYLRDFTDDEKVKAELLSVSEDVDKVGRELISKRKKMINKYSSERLGIYGLLDAEKVVTGLTRLFSPMSRMAPAAIRTMTRLYEEAIDGSTRKALAFGRSVQEIVDKIPDKKAAYKLLFKTNEKGERIHQLIDEIDPKFGEELKKHKGEDLKSFLQENIDYEGYIKAVNARLKSVLDNISGPNADNVREKMLAKYDPNHPLFRAQNALVWDYVKKDKWYSKEYRELQKNPQALALYNKARELGETAANIGYIDYHNKRNFIAFFQKGLIENLLNGHASPVQDMLDSLSASEKATLGATDDLSGQRRYTLPKYAASQGEQATERISDDVGRILVDFARVLYHYEAMDSIIGQTEAIRHMEQLKGHLRGSKLGGIPQRDPSGRLIEDPGNVENARLFEDFEQFLIYNNRFPITQSDTDIGLGKFANYMKKFANNVSEKLTGRRPFSENETPGAVSMTKFIEAMNRGTQLKIIGLSPMASLSNAFGLQIQAASQGGRYYKFKEWMNNERFFLFQKFANRSEKDKWAALIDTFLPLLEDPNRELWKEVGISKVTGNVIQDYLFIGFRKPEFLAQMATFKSVLDNTIVVDGKLMNIADHVKTLYPNIDTDPKVYQKYRAEREGKINELRSKSLTNIVTEKDGKIEIPGFDMTNAAEVRKLSLLTKRISRDISGNMNETDVSRASLDIFMRSMMVFKNWIPKLVSTRFGSLQQTNDPYDQNSYDIGKVRLFWHVFMEHMNFRWSAISNILKATDKGMEELQKLYEYYKEEYETRTGKEFTMSTSEFNDMIIRNLQNQVRELVILLSMLALWMGTGFLEPPDDPQAKAAFNTGKRMVDQMINELSFFYNPMDWEHLIAGTVFPSISMLSDTMRLVANLGTEMTGIDMLPSTEGFAEAREHAHPVKYALKLVPGARQWVNYMMVFAPDMAKEMEIPAPPSASY